MKAPTRNDVARLAGTSTAVVSYVMNGGPRAVTEATRAKVLRAVEELGYRPNSIARALKVQRSKILGLVVPDNSNPYFAEVAHEVEQVCFDAGYMLFLGNSMQNVDRQQRYIDTFIDTQVDGLIVLPRDHANAPALAIRGIPVELVVAIDNELAGYMATKHLIDHGHRYIGALSGEPGVWPATERLEGFHRALREAGLPTPPVLSSEFSTESAVRVTRRLLSDHPELTAVFAPTDVQGLGVIRGAGLERRTVPRGLAVTAVDGTLAAGLSAPGLTTVREPVAALAGRSVERLVNRIESRAQPTLAPLTIALVRRGSCGCPDDVGSLAGS